MPNKNKASRFTHAVKPLNVQPTKEATTSQNVNPKELNEKDYIIFLTKQLNEQNAQIEALKARQATASKQNNALTTQSANSHTFHNGERHLFTLNDEIAVDLHNCIASFFYSENAEYLSDSLKAEQSLLFDLLQSAVANSDLEDSFLKGLFVEQCARFSEFINIGYKIYFESTTLRN